MTQQNEIMYQEMDNDNFDNLCEYHNGELLHGIYEFGFQTPSQIQIKAISVIINGKDIIAQAQSGSGKTGAFVIGSLTKINLALRRPQCIIIANTKVLALQIENVVKNIGKYIGKDTNNSLRISLCIGGETKETMANLREASASHVLIGTPGRLVGLVKRDEYESKKYPRKNNVGLFDNVKILVLDEADKLLEQSFRDEMRSIFDSITSTCQICLFSATYIDDILNLTKNFMNDPVKILVEKEKISVDTIKNYYVDAKYENNKYDILIDIYQKVSVCQAVIFVNSIKKAIEISESLANDGHSVGTIHSKLSDTDRADVLRDFRRTQTRILIATDIISRGIDVQQVGLVINYDIPSEPEQYIHRVGRSGRFGKSGVAITLLTSHYGDKMRIKNIESSYGIKFNQLPSLETVNNYLTGTNGYNLMQSK